MTAVPAMSRALAALLLALASGVLEDGRRPSGAARGERRAGGTWQVPPDSLTGARAAEPTAAPGAEGSRTARVRDVLEEQRRTLRIPGLAVVVVEDDRILLIDGLGLRDLEKRLPVTPDTLFPIGSCTKSFTAMAAAMSQDDGFLTLDDAPKKYLPWFHLSDPEADELVTLRDLLSHRTGLMAKADLAAEPGVLTREEFVRAAMAAKPTAKLRARFQYSNAMYVAAGEAIARARKSTWESTIEKRIFQPLGMTSSVASVRDVARAADHATGYEDGARPGTWRPVAPPGTLVTMAPAGSIASTAHDMARWLRFLTGGGAIEGRRAVSASRLAEMTTPHMPVSASTSYGLGWAIYDWNGHKVVEHNGGGQGISALMSFMPERRVGLALLCNRSPTALTAIRDAGTLLWPILLGEPERKIGSKAAATTPTASPTATPPRAAEDLPAVDDLLARMAAAAGGENVRRHRSFVAKYRKSYENQGVEAELTVRARAPALLDEEERWTAAGKPIGTLRIAFDGARGVQETTFGQDMTLEGDELEDLRRRAAFRGVLDLARTYERLRVVRASRAGDEDAYVLEASAAKGAPDLLHVSSRTFLVLEIEKGGETRRFSDFRSVDGQVVPFRIAIADGLGDSLLRLSSIDFDAPVPDSAFAPTKPAAAAPR